MATVENWWCHKRNMKYETSKARQWEKNITTKCCKHVNTNHSHTHIHTKTHTHRCVISLSSSSRPLKDVLLAGAGLIHIHSRPFASNNFHMGQLGWHKPSPFSIIMINDHDQDPNRKKYCKYFIFGGCWDGFTQDRQRDDINQRDRGMSGC